MAIGCFYPTVVPDLRDYSVEQRKVIKCFGCCNVLHLLILLITSVPPGRSFRVFGCGSPEALGGDLHSELRSKGGVGYSAMPLPLAPVIRQRFALCQGKFVRSDEFDQMEYAPAFFRMRGEIVTELP